MDTYLMATTNLQNFIFWCIEIKDLEYCLTQKLPIWPSIFQNLQRHKYITLPFFQESLWVDVKILTLVETFEISSKNYSYNVPSDEIQYFVSDNSSL